MINNVILQGFLLIWLILGLISYIIMILNLESDLENIDDILLVDTVKSMLSNKNSRNLFYILALCINVLFGGLIILDIIVNKLTGKDLI